MFRIRSVLPLATLAIVAACADAPTGTLGGKSDQPSLFVYDQTNNFGNEHFAWLFSAPGAYTGPTGPDHVFNPNYMPKLEICEWNPATSKCAVANALHTYTRVAGTPRVYVSTGMEWYNIRLMASDLAAIQKPSGVGSVGLTLTPGKEYRAWVKLMNATVGIIDIKEYADFASAASNDPTQNWAHVAGQPLDLYWRIENGAIFAIDQTTGGSFSAVDGAVLFIWDPYVFDALTEDKALWVQPADCYDDPTSTGNDAECTAPARLVDGAGFKVGPDKVRLVAGRAHLVITYDPTSPSITDETKLTMVKWNGGQQRWDVCGYPNSGTSLPLSPYVTPNLVNKTVTCDITSHGIYGVWQAP
jgi:hypothetical protein